jgi:polyisoprenoid-binding protein YceI
MPAATYDIDSTHSSAHFSVRHLMISNVKGEFTKVSGKVTFDPDNPKDSTVEATIDVSTLHTRDEQRDGHLKSPEFFDVAQFPEIKFVSTSIEPDGKYEYLVKGNMTIHGVTKEVALQVEGPTPEVKDPWGNLKTGATASTVIDRRDFGLKWNSPLESGGVLIGDEVKISLEVELTRRTA